MVGITRGTVLLHVELVLSMSKRRIGWDSCQAMLMLYWRFLSIKGTKCYLSRTLGVTKGTQESFLSVISIGPHSLSRYAIMIH